MKKHIVSIAVVAVLAFLLVILWVTNGDNFREEPVWKTDLTLGKVWTGDYPVAELDRLPEGQRALGTGYIDDKGIFESVWEVFKPDESIPDIDFSKDIVVFVRNIKFYNATRIFKITVEQGEVEVLAMETLSARPIEGVVSMSMTAISREGVRSIRAGDSTVPIKQGL